MTLMVGAVALLRHTSPFLSFFVRVEVAGAVKEEGPASVGYAGINGSITSRSPVVTGQKECALIAINRLG